MPRIESFSPLDCPGSPQKGASPVGQMSQIMEALGQQQSTLQAVLEMQAELHRLFVAHTNHVEEHFSSVEAPSAESEEQPQNDEVVEQTLPRANSGHFKKELRKRAGQGSDTDLRPSVVNPAKGSSMRVWMRFVLAHKRFDIAMSAVVVVNIICFFSEIQSRAWHLQYLMGRRDDDGHWETAKPVFAILESLFNAIYLSEIILQAIFRSRAFFKWNFLHFVDVLSVFLSAFASFVLVPLNLSVGVLFRCIKLLRVLRLLRLLKILRLMESLYSLRVLIRALSASLGSLFWSMFVLAFVILSAAMVMTELTADFLANPNTDPVARDWVYEYFGSFWRASYTMFEATFSGIWAGKLSRPLVQYLGYSFRLFWVIYVVSVNFAVVRVIGALFLKQTLDVAAIDKDKMAAAKLREREKVLSTLEEIFRMGDESGDGEITREEFEEMMTKDAVLDMFAELELEPADVFTLYNILCEDDGVADQQEFLSGAMKLKTPLTTVEMIQLLHEQLTMKRTLKDLESSLAHVDKAVKVHPKHRGKHHNRRREPNFKETL